MLHQHFVLKMKAKDKSGAVVQTSRNIYGDDKALNETAWLLCSLAIMEGYHDIHIAGVYSEQKGEEVKH
jgi:hypothetical protein